MILADRARIIHAVLVREVKSRSPKSRLGYVLDLMQPCMQLGMMYGVFFFIGRRPDFGNNLFLFLVSGIIPYFLFTHIVSHVMGTMSRYRVMAPYRVVMAFDIAIAFTILELIAITILGVGSLVIASMVGVHNVAPHDYVQIVLSVLVLALTGLGVGMCNAQIAQVFGAWRSIWTVIARSLIFFSNVFYVVDYFPPIARNILWWNPLLHGVIWFRIGMFPKYPTLTFSLDYLLVWCVGSLLLALVLENVLPEAA